MLSDKIFGRPATKIAPKSTNFGKYQKTKAPVRKFEQEENKQNNSGCSNMMSHSHIVDVTKRIRKRSPKKLTKTTHQTFNGFRVYKDEDLDFEPELAKLSRPQRIDNDVDTDEEQLQSGINRMYQFLKEACLQKMYAEDQM